MMLTAPSSDVAGQGMPTRGGCWMSVGVGRLVDVATGVALTVGVGVPLGVMAAVQRRRR
jgi:hypothetical protein